MANPRKPSVSPQVVKGEKAGAARDSRQRSADRSKSGQDFLRGLAKAQAKSTYGNEDQRAVQMDRMAKSFKETYGGRTAKRSGEGRADTATARAAAAKGAANNRAGRVAAKKK